MIDTLSSRCPMKFKNKIPMALHVVFIPAVLAHRFYLQGYKRVCTAGVTSVII